MGQDQNSSSRTLQSSRGEDLFRPASRPKSGQCPAPAHAPSGTRETPEVVDRGHRRGGRSVEVPVRALGRSRRQADPTGARRAKRRERRGVELSFWGVRLASLKKGANSAHDGANDPAVTAEMPMTQTQRNGVL